MHADVNLRKFVAKMDELIRSGRSASARRKLEGLFSDPGRAAAIPRALGVDFAALFRRVGLFERSVRLLHRWVRGEPGAPTDAERAEYAASLIQLGGAAEGLELLRAVDPRHCPQALLFSAFAHFGSWDYDRAIPPLRGYVESPLLTDYQRRVGLLNLGSALVAERNFDEARGLLLSLIQDAKARSESLMAGNALMILAQTRIPDGDWALAERELKEAASLLSEVSSFDGLYVKKWLAIVALGREGPTRRARGLLSRVRAEAMERCSWETVRECDFHLGVATRNPALLRRVHFGTPYPRYRKRVEKTGLLPRGPATAPCFPWALPGFGGRSGPPRELSWPEDLQLKPGGLLSRLSLALSSDFYRPQRLVSLHSALYPGRHYNPSSSPDTVHQAVRRLRIELEARRLPVEIAESGGAYQLQAARPVTLWIQPEAARAAPAGTFELRISRLRERLGGKLFSRQRAQTELGLSERSTNEILSEARRLGLIRKTGAGPGVRYELVPLRGGTEEPYGL